MSVQALIERTWEMQMISAAQRTRFYKALSARGWRTREPLSDEILPESPELPRKIGETLAAGGLSLQEIAELAGFACPGPGNPYLPMQKLRAL
jgi:Zn-dependent peptidase ImmA (M78 family)